MGWKSRLLILLILALPAFIGYPVRSFDTEIIAGVRLGWVLYALVIHAAILGLTGPGFAEKALTVAVLISGPVVFLGAAASYVIQMGDAAAYSAHYVSLAVSMLTVIPLALALIALVPFHRFEQRLLAAPAGVSKSQKYALMFLRVFNHIVYSVIPGVLEVISEERRYRLWLDRQHARPNSVALWISVRRRWLAALIADMIQIGVEGICASIQYIPLWAFEISQLPGKSGSR